MLLMPQVELAGEMYEVDEKGFLQEPERWNEAVARTMAAKEGVDQLTDEHWRAINYLRSYYLQNGICPMVRKFKREMGLSLSRIYELFPNGPANSACKWAGVPKPTGCV
jgi:tRNA 2-thiouridine synthesizing protein E